MNKRGAAVLITGVVIAVVLIAAFLLPFLFNKQPAQFLQDTVGGKGQSGNVTQQGYPRTSGQALSYDEQDNIRKKTVCAYDGYSRKGISRVTIYVDGIRAGRTTELGCVNVMMPNDDPKHELSIKGKSLLRSFTDMQTIDFTYTQHVEFYIDLYSDQDLYEIAYNLVNDYRLERNLSVFNRGNDLSAQRWAEHLHRAMITENGMMENARVQIAQTHGFINERYTPDCIKASPSDCSPTYYTYSCEEPDCTIERGDTVKKIVSGMLSNKSFKSTQYSYITVGISYDPHVMFLVVNFK